MSDPRPKPPFCWCHDDQIPDDAAEDVADAAPQDGETYVSSWGEMLYEMTHGEMGTPPPKTFQRYHPPQTRETKPPDAEEANAKDEDQHD